MMVTKRLATPFVHDPGYGAPSTQYDRIAILSLSIEFLTGELIMRVQYGNLDGDNWIGGVLAPTTISVVNRPVKLLPPSRTGQERSIPADLAFDRDVQQWLLSFMELAYAHIATENNALEIM